MEQRRAPGAAAVAAKYGLVLGVLWFVVFLVGALTAIKQGWVAPLTNIVLLAVLMVLAHRAFKRTHDGMMTYSQGLGSGTLLAIAGAVVSCILVYLYVKFVNTGYLAAALQARRAALEQSGMTGAQVQQAMAINSAIFTPVGIVVFSVVTSVIVGFIVALIVSIFTQKGDPRAVI